MQPIIKEEIIGGTNMTQLVKKSRGSQWMVPFEDSLGNVFSNRPWHEWSIMKKEEWGPIRNFFKKDGMLIEVMPDIKHNPMC